MFTYQTSRPGGYRFSPKSQLHMLDCAGTSAAKPAAEQRKPWVGGVLDECALLTGTQQCRGRQCLSSRGRQILIRWGSRRVAKVSSATESKWVTSMCNCSFFPANDYGLKLLTCEETASPPGLYLISTLMLLVSDSSRCPPSEWAHPTWSKVSFMCVCSPALPWFPWSH